MSEKPISMSGPMVRAILAGRKTVTRRPMKPQPPDWCKDFGITCFTPVGHVSGRGIYGDDGQAEKFFKLNYQPGDTLWVREAWKTYDSVDHLPPRDIPTGSAIAYLADGEPSFHVGRYRHARFMCRWMSRIDLTIISVRAELLQDIAEEEAMREGITGDDALVGQIENPYRTAFAGLWNEIYGPWAWEGNPWVWRYEFVGVKA